jgi:hypothetical protein
MIFVHDSTRLAGRQVGMALDRRIGAGCGLDDVAVLQRQVRPAETVDARPQRLGLARHEFLECALDAGGVADLETGAGATVGE